MTIDKELMKPSNLSYTLFDFWLASTQ